MKIFKYDGYIINLEEVREICANVDTLFFCYRDGGRTHIVCNEDEIADLLDLCYEIMTRKD